MNRKSVSFAHLKQVCTPTSQISLQFPHFFTQQDLLVKEANIRNNIDKKEEGEEGKKEPLWEFRHLRSVFTLLSLTMIPLCLIITLISSFVSFKHFPSSHWCSCVFISFSHSFFTGCGLVCLAYSPLHCKSKEGHGKLDKE